MKRVLLIVAVSLLVALAGCGGDGGSTPAAGDGGSTSAGDGGTGSTDGSSTDAALVGDLESTLRAAGSFTAELVYAGTLPDGQTTQLRYSYLADLEDGRFLIRSDAGEGTGFEQFTNADGTYARFGSGDSAFYQAVAQDRDVVAEAAAFGLVYDRGIGSGLRSIGTETFDGVDVTRYELTEVDRSIVNAGFASAGAQGTDEFTVEDFEYVVLVDGDGLARLESWTYAGTQSGQSVSYSWEYTLTGIGQTTVDDPDWLDEAVAAAG
jgi:hypothetical protein